MGQRNSCSNPCITSTCVCSESSCVFNFAQTISDQELHQERQKVWDELEGSAHPEDRIKAHMKLAKLEKEISRRQVKK